MLETVIDKILHILIDRVSIHDWRPSKTGIIGNNEYSLKFFGNSFGKKTTTVTINQCSLTNVYVNFYIDNKPILTMQKMMQDGSNLISKLHLLVAEKERQKMGGLLNNLYNHLSLN